MTEGWVLILAESLICRNCYVVEVWGGKYKKLKLKKALPITSCIEGARKIDNNSISDFYCSAICDLSGSTSAFSVSIIACCSLLGPLNDHASWMQTFSIRKKYRFKRPLNSAKCQKVKPLRRNNGRLLFITLSQLRLAFPKKAYTMQKSQPPNQTEQRRLPTRAASSCRHINTVAILPALVR